MFYVFLLRSVYHLAQTYIGFTKDLKKRLKAHNAGQPVHTATHKPWKRVTYLAFETEQKARAFETCPKSHSGMAFANKRLW